MSANRRGESLAEILGHTMNERPEEPRRNARVMSDFMSPEEVRAFTSHMVNAGYSGIRMSPQIGAFTGIRPGSLGRACRDMIRDAKGLACGNHDRPRLERFERVEAGEVDPGHREAARL